jgi:GT2 family glycosyltransferase
LVRVAEADHRIAMATPRVFYYDRPTEIYWDGGVIDWDTGETPHDSRGLPVEGHLRKTEWLDGCSLLVRVSAIEDVGLLDERYFLYFEDVECSVRALRRGWTNAVALQAHAWHKVSRSTGGLASPAVRYYYARDRYLFMNAHCPAVYLWKLHYASRLFREYRLVQHECEGRRVSLVLSRWEPYEATADFRRFVRVLDVLLLLAFRGASVVARFLLPIRQVRDLFAAGKSGGRRS